MISRIFRISTLSVSPAVRVGGLVSIGSILVLLGLAILLWPKLLVLLIGGGLLGSGLVLLATAWKLKRMNNPGKFRSDLVD